MAHVLVAKISEWYQSIASLKNMNEKELENSILLYATKIFNNYYCFQSGYTFQNAAGEKSKPDLILISKNFKSWILVEVELAGKSLDHTKMQLRVFTSPILSHPTFDLKAFVKHCIRKQPLLRGKEKQVSDVIINGTLDVLVIFDSYNWTAFEELSSTFTIKICVFEVYRTGHHSIELYRISGDYPYLISGHTFLRADRSHVLYKVERPEFFDDIFEDGVNEKNLVVEHRLMAMNLKMKQSKDKSVYVSIEGNYFPAGKDLVISKTEDSKFIIEKF